MEHYKNILLELDKLKSVYRRSYITLENRTETTAEHSWHLAMTLMAFKKLIPDDIDLNHAIRLALAHDVCEIGAGDISVYDINRHAKHDEELEYLNNLSDRFPQFGVEMKNLWMEYEQKLTPESQWVHVFDRLLPFVLNISTEGKNWMEQDVSKAQVLAVNLFIKDISLPIFKWMELEIEKAVEKGWLKK